MLKAGFLSLAFLVPLAQVMPDGTWERWLLQGSAFSALLWVLYNLIKTELPAQRSAFTSTIDKMLAAHAEAQKVDRDTWRAEADEERKAHRATVDRLAATIESKDRALSDLWKLKG